MRLELDPLVRKAFVIAVISIEITFPKFIAMAAKNCVSRGEAEEEIRDAKEVYTLSER